MNTTKLKQKQKATLSRNLKKYCRLENLSMNWKKVKD